jgi:phosphoserine aminotransferase
MSGPPPKPKCPNFSSGPCAKRPGYTPGVALADTPWGRSHRAPIGLNKIKESMAMTREILKIPKDYHVAMVPASDTGAVEMMMWQLLGPRGVTVCHWESFGGGWYSDAKNQLKLPKLRNLTAPFGSLPDMNSIDWNDDVVFTWNGTTSGVRVPNGDWIPADRQGLSICDATSAAFAMDIPWDKIDVLTFSWQKCLGGEGAHGMLIISPRTVQRLESYKPTIPIPKIFRLTKGGKLDKGIFNGSVINTPSMACFEDYLDALKWAKACGGLEGLVARSMRNFGVIKKFVADNDWIEFLAKDPATVSNTSVCLVIKDLDKAQVKTMTSMLDRNKVAYDIGSYRDAPPGLRIWCGPTVETADVEALMPWIAYVHDKVKSGSIKKMKIIVTDGLAAGAIKALQGAGHEVVKKKLSKEELAAGALADWDAIIIRSATKCTANVIQAAVAKPGSKLRLIARAGVGVDNVDLKAASAAGVMVVNSPLSATNSVVELALAHLLSQARKIPRADRGLREGKWLKNECVGHELAGKNLGFIGFGRIGQGLGRVAKALGMNIHVYDPFLPQAVIDQFGATRHATVADVFRACTHITIHAFLSPQTRHMVNLDMMKLMPGVAPDGTKCGNHIVNCGRGGIIDEVGAAEALKQGVLGSLALDVFEKEPVGKSPLMESEAFQGSPHVGASTIEAQNRVGAEIAGAVLAALDGSPPMGNLVNKDVQPKFAAPKARM